MSTNEKTVFLYGRAKDWGELSYDDALRRKIMLATGERRIELDKHYSKRIPNRVKTLSDAIEHNENLLNE